MNAFEVFFVALMMVESQGDDMAVGDEGKSRGPYQIQRKYWTDAQKQFEAERKPQLAALRYNDYVNNRLICRVFIRAYWRKYEPEAYKKAKRGGSFEVLARLHNGGPKWNKGRRKAKTAAYWVKVRNEMARMRVEAKAKEKK